MAFPAPPAETDEVEGVQDRPAVGGNGGLRLAPEPAKDAAIEPPDDPSPRPTLKRIK
jgi:hypothetical protein